MSVRSVSASSSGFDPDDGLLPAGQAEYNHC